MANTFKQLGVLWTKTSQAGNKFYSGRLNLKEAGLPDKDIPVIVFKNNQKRPEKNDPDLQIFLSQPKEGAAPAKKAPASKPAEKSTPAQAPAPTPEDNDPIL